MSKQSTLLLLATLPFAPSCSTEADASGASAALLAPASRDGWNPTTAFAGFTLIAPLDSMRVYLVDMAGEEVHHWDTASKPGVSTYLTDRGTLLKAQRKIDHPIFQDAGGHGGWVQEIAADGEVLWDFEWDSESGLQHHDIEEMPNGNVLVIAWDRSDRDVAIEAGRDPDLLEGEEWWACAVYEIQPTRPSGGEVVWSWHAMDHLVQNHDADLPHYGKPSEHPARIDINGDRNPDPPDEEEQKKIDDQMAAIGYAGGDDDGRHGDDEEEEEEEDPVDTARKARVKNADWMHTNGIDYNAKLDQIALSVRRFDEVWIIDHALTTEEAKGPQGDLLYRWGNPFAYGMGEFEERQLLGQHHVEWIPEGQLGAGNLMVFNNGADPREWSTATEWWAPRDENGRYPRADGEPWGPARADWEYEAPEAKDFFSPFISGVQRLPNGNTLICSGAPGHVFEVTPDGEVVWDWKNPFTIIEGEVEDDDMKKFPTALFRATRYAADHPAIVALRKAGAPVPESAGTGPATNQYEPPEPEVDPEEEAEDDG